MPFPRINHCIICEDIRQEVGNKASIGGFYGIAPDVQIVLQDLTLPLQSLMFLLLADQAEGQYRVTPRVIAPNGTPVFQVETDLQIATPGRRNYFGIGTRGVRFPMAGIYTFQLVIDGHVHYEARFEVVQGPVPT